jgi:hypothetical protein
MLKRCVDDLQILYTESIAILRKLLVTSSAAIIQRLCARFNVLQENFASCYYEAREHAIAALGHVEAFLSFP